METFAATLVPAAVGMTASALRDHAPAILLAVVKDLEAPKTRDQQSAKSKGWAPKVEESPEIAAQTHAVLRARSGFDIVHLIAEYRALRASVRRLWMDQGPLDRTAVEDIIRFNEAIDQAVAESVAHFHAQVERARNLLLGMLGHDMRSPLNTVVTSASYLAALNASEEVSKAAALLIRSGAAMQALLNELVDFNRTKLGLGIDVAPAEVDLAARVADEAEQLCGAHGRRRNELTTSGDCRGQCDGPRLQQVLRNLVLNAFQYGSTDTPVRVALLGGQDQIRLEVTNGGHPLDAVQLREYFEPLKRGVPQRGGERENLGLGLFIVREVTRAHRGAAEVSCDGGEVTFAVTAPRRVDTGPARAE